MQELLVTLSEAHDEVKRALKQKDFFMAQDILAACQECAIEIGNAIEETEGENAPSVLCVQNYCVELVEIYSQIDNDAEHVSYAEVSNDLHKHLMAMLDGVEGIPVKLEVVFLPYKASMWDSLESVWRAADADETCDAYVVPIPYFDLKPDGGVGEMHDESGEYGDVPVLSWKEYDIAARQPDMIFIHNPYDECNNITTVPPAFFAKELVKHTKQLVYIPYFVAGENVAEHFCVLPGTVYAHKVILESEKIRDKYVSVFGKWAKESGYERINPNWEEKFLALGSPKFDKVTETDRDDSDLPAEWREKLYDADGKRKKSVFYNTSVQALLNHPNMLEKIKYVLHVFKENPGTVLWWRPHPLYESTLENMRPELLEEYRAIVEAYKEEGFGIFDDTPDMNRAIAQTDAYYGDPGSVVALYRKTGKPVMVQNAEVLGE